MRQKNSPSLVNTSEGLQRGAHGARVELIVARDHLLLVTLTA